MKKNLSKGFTLIELLVVIAIIGILASVILASLNTARAKGADAAIKSDLANARAQAELFYDGAGNAYTGVCTDSTTGIKKITDDAAAKSGVAVACNASASAWAASATLKTTGAASAVQYFCVDSSGASKQTGTALGTGTVCI